MLQGASVVVLAASWKETPEEIRQAYEYIEQIIHDLDVAFNHGEGKTYGVHIH
ncbi:hypothetical protein [Lentibacillus cibarius]|uniref:hypothetical protein n=1 Tax=Lentibacillus cibarius TaxID=2583219 RepID=UPI00163D8020|nr:hypothetical protein [Lentibacillus cibarius]